jgi:hypothetical protein
MFRFSFAIAPEAILRASVIEKRDEVRFELSLSAKADPQIVQEFSKLIFRDWRNNYHSGFTEVIGAL